MSIHPRGSRDGHLASLCRAGLLGAVALVGCDSSEPPAGPSAEPHETAAAAVGDRWIKRADLPNIVRYGHAAAVVSNSAGQPVLYVIGGAQDDNQASGPTRDATPKVHAYNAVTNDWFLRQRLPLDLYQSNGAGVIGGKIYVSGGRQSGDKRYVRALLVYDPARNSWTRKADMPTVTWGGMTAVWNNQLYVLTCTSEEDCGLANRQSLYRYNPATDTWTFLSFTPVELDFPRGGFIGGKLYATGGRFGTLLVYDPATNQWTSRAPLTRAPRRPAGLALGGKLYIVGGLEDSGGEFPTPSRRTSVYDPTSNTWTELAPMPTPRSDFAAARVVVNGRPRLQVVGGVRPGNNLQYVP